MGVQPDQSAYDGPPPAPTNNKRKRKHEHTIDNASLRHDENGGGDGNGDNEVVPDGLVTGIKKKAKKTKDPSTADPPAEKRLRRSVCANPPPYLPLLLFFF